MQALKVKCDRCGQDALKQEGILLARAEGKDAIATLYFNAPRGSLTANVCDSCSMELKRLGWKLLI